MPLDVLNDQLGAAEMTHLRLLLGVVHRVGHVPHQHDVLSLIHHLADAEWPAQHAHIRMHAHQDHVLDAALLEQVVGLGAVGDRVPCGDLQGLDLLGEEPHAGAGLGVFAWVAVFDREGRLFLLVQVAPALQRDFGLHRRGLLRQLALRCPFVLVEAAAGAMDDQDAALPRGGEDFVHPRRHLGHASRRRAAIVIVPHVANDDRRLPGVPR